MITSEFARSGHEILKIEGRLLASSFDPHKEAIGWAKRAGEGLAPMETVVVLGMGCGYHVSALSESRPENPVLVLEPNADVAARALILNPSISTHDVVVGSDLFSLTQSGRIRDSLGGLFRIAPHGPTIQIHPVWSDQVTAFLLARDKTSFLLQLRMRPELHALMDPEAIRAIADEPVSIKTLKQLFAEDKSLSHERRLWRCLEELVV